MHAPEIPTASSVAPDDEGSGARPMHTAPESLEDALFASAFEAMSTGDFARGQEIFSHLYELGARTPEVILGFTICADQNGNEALAARLLGEAAQRAATGDAPSPDLYPMMRDWLPGGKHARSQREDLAATARRFLPRLK